MNFLVTVLMLFNGVLVAQADGVNFSEDLTSHKKWAYKNVPLNDERKIHLFEECANNGDLRCANIIGKSYVFGAGHGVVLRRDKNVSSELYEKAKYWLNMAAKKNDVNSLERLGTIMYIYGDNKDKSEGVRLLVKATTFDKGENRKNWETFKYSFYSAQKLLVIYKFNMIERERWASWLSEYEDGRYKLSWAYSLQNEYKDIGLATKLFSMLTDKEVSESSVAYPSNLNLIKLYKSCLQESVTKFYGVKLACAMRGELTLALNKAKVKSVRMDINYFYDKFDGKSFHPEASELFIGYTRYDEGSSFNYQRFASMIVYFPSSLDVKQLIRVKDFISLAYGEPTFMEGNPLVGNASYTWKREDGVKLLVQRSSWPSTSVELLVEYKPMKLIFDRQLSNINSKKQKTSPFE